MFTLAIDAAGQAGVVRVSSVLETPAPLDVFVAVDLRAPMGDEDAKVRVHGERFAEAVRLGLAEADRVTAIACGQRTVSIPPRALRLARSSASWFSNESLAAGALACVEAQKRPGARAVILWVMRNNSGYFSPETAGKLAAAGSVYITDAGAAPMSSQHREVLCGNLRVFQTRFIGDVDVAGELERVRRAGARGATVRVQVLGRPDLDVSERWPLTGSAFMHFSLQGAPRPAETRVTVSCDGDAQPRALTPTTNDSLVRATRTLEFLRVTARAGCGPVSATVRAAFSKADIVAEEDPDERVRRTARAVVKAFGSPDGLRIDFDALLGV